MSTPSYVLRTGWYDLPVAHRVPLLQGVVMAPGNGYMILHAELRHKASPIIDSNRSGGPRGYDAGKKVKGRKRHIVVDTLGLPLVHPADIQDRDGARLVWPGLGRFPRLQSDGAWGIGRVQDGGRLDPGLVRRPAQQHTFQVCPGGISNLQRG